MRESYETARLAIPVSNDRDHFQGPADAPVTLVEYGDFECPHCRAAHLLLEEIKPDFAGRVKLVFRNFPLAESHPHAQRAAEAAEAAAAQGKFWEMHDALFAHQQSLDDDNLLEYARAVAGLPSVCPGIVRRTLHGPSPGGFLGGVRSGVNGTPTFFINDLRLDGGFSGETMLAAIDAAADQAGKGKDKSAGTHRSRKQ